MGSKRHNPYDNSCLPRARSLNSAAAPKNKSPRRADRPLPPFGVSPERVEEIRNKLRADALRRAGPQPPKADHVCYNSRGGKRCDVCFGEVPAPTPTQKRTRVLQASSAERKQMPIFSGVIAYFPDALAEVARISFLGNQKHNPGQDLHWARGKSMDHADCAARHLAEHGTLDTEGVRHTAQLAWRSLALLQEELERDLGLPLPRGAKIAE